MSRAIRSQNATHNYQQGSSSLAVRNRARKLGASLDALMSIDADKALLIPHYSKLPTSTLADYHARNEVVDALFDQDREPYLVSREALSFDLYPMIEVWDVYAELIKVGRGGRFMRQSMVMVSTQRGDALLSPDTLLMWR